VSLGALAPGIDLQILLGAERLDNLDRGNLSLFGVVGEDAVQFQLVFSRHQQGRIESAVDCIAAGNLRFDNVKRIDFGGSLLARNRGGKANRHRAGIHGEDGETGNLPHLFHFDAAAHVGLFREFGGFSIVQVRMEERDVLKSAERALPHLAAADVEQCVIAKRLGGNGAGSDFFTVDVNRGTLAVPAGNDMLAFAVWHCALSGDFLTAKGEDNRIFAALVASQTDFDRIVFPVAIADGEQLLGPLLRKESDVESNRALFAGIRLDDGIEEALRRLLLLFFLHLNQHAVRQETGLIGADGRAVRKFGGRFAGKGARCAGIPVRQDDGKILLQRDNPVNFFGNPRRKGKSRCKSSGDETRVTHILFNLLNRMQ